MAPFSFSLLLLLYVTATSRALTPPLQVATRRAALIQGIGGCISTTAACSIVAAPPASAAATPTIASRLETDSLKIPAPSYASELNGVDNLYFPSWMAGEWSVTQTLVDASTPLGLKFVGGPNGSPQIATDTMEEAKKQIGKPVSLTLRYIPTKWGVAEDRLYNSRQRLDAFANKSVVASVEYANVGASNRQSVLAMGGREEDPLQTAIVRFKGPAAQKTFVVSHGADEERTVVSDESSTTYWAGYELNRSIFALTNQNTAPPLTTDSELIWEMVKLDDGHVKAKLRIAGYLNPQSDTLYFDARQRAVSLQDYVLDFRRKQ